MNAGKKRERFALTDGEGGGVVEGVRVEPNPGAWSPKEKPEERLKGW